jgi:hypothetical protein
MNLLKSATKTKIVVAPAMAMNLIQMPTMVFKRKRGSPFLVASLIKFPKELR